MLGKKLAFVSQGRPQGAEIVAARGRFRVGNLGEAGERNKARGSSEKRAPSDSKRREFSPKLARCCLNTRN